MSGGRARGGYTPPLHTANATAAWIGIPPQAENGYCYCCEGVYPPLGAAGATAAARGVDPCRGPRELPSCKHVYIYTCIHVYMYACIYVYMYTCTLMKLHYAFNSCVRLWEHQQTRKCHMLKLGSRSWSPPHHGLLLVKRI